VNVVQLRDTINTLLSASPDLIGTYTLPDASTVPAIYTVGRQSVPSDWKVTGLEVTMREFPEQLPSAMVGAVKVLQLWEVMLVQYTSSSSTYLSAEDNFALLYEDDTFIYQEVGGLFGTPLFTAMERMTRRFPDGTFRYLPGNDVAYERCRIIIPDTILRNIYPAI
jgi:hypothetical protein